MIALIGTTIERNVTSSSRNAAESTNANTNGDVRLQRVVEVAHPPRCRRRRTASTPSTDPIVGATTSSRSTSSACVRLLLGPVAGDLDIETCRPSCRGSRPARASLAGKQRVCSAAAFSSFASPPVTAGAVTSSALMTTSSDEVSVGNASCSRLNVWTTGSSCGSESDVLGVPMSMPRPGSPAPPAAPVARHGRQQRAPQHPVHDARPDAERGHAVAETTEAGNPALLDAIAEHRQHGGQHRERSEHRDGDDRDRAGGERRERRGAGEVHAGHRDHDRDAGDEHGATRGRGGRLDRRFLAPCRRRAPRAPGGGRTARSPRRRPGR